MVGRARENLPGGSIKYLLHCLNIRIFKCRYRSGCDLSEQQSIDSNIVAAVLFEMFLMLFLMLFSSLDAWFEVVCSWIGDVFQMSYMFAAVFGMRCLLWLSTNLKVDGLFAVGCCVVSVVGYHWKVLAINEICMTFGQSPSHSVADLIINAELLYLPSGKLT